MIARRKIYLWVHVFSLAVFLLGGFLTWSDARRQIAMHHGKLVEENRHRVQALNLERIRHLNTSPEAGENDPIYLRVRDQIQNLASQTGEPTTLRLIGCDPERRVTFRIEAPAKEIETAPPDEAEVAEAFNLTAPTLLCPLPSAGSGYSRYTSPVRNPRSGQVMAVLIADFDRHHAMWPQIRASLPAALVTIMLIIATHATGWAIRQRARGDALAHGQVLAERWFTFVVLASLSGYIAWRVYVHQQVSREKTFADLAAVKSDAIKNAFASMRDLNLESLGRFFEASDKVTRAEFIQFTEYLNRIFEFESWAWVEPVTHAGRDAFEARMRLEFDGNYMIWENGPDGKPVPAQQRDLYYPVLYSSPKLRYGSAGFDSGSSPARLEAMRIAMETGITTVSDPVTVSSTTQSGMILYRPVYHQDGAFRGFVVTAIDVDRTLNLYQQGHVVVSKPVLVDVYSVKAGESPRFLGSTDPSYDPAVSPRATRLIKPFFYGGKTLVFHYREGPDFSAPTPLPVAIITMAAGLAFAAIGSLIVGQFFRRRELLERLVGERTAALTESLERFDAVAGLSQEIIWETDTNGLYTYVSPIIIDILGFRPDEIIGKKHFYDLAPEDQRDEVRAAASEHIRQGTIIRDFENPVLSKSGEVVWILTNVAPIKNSRGEITGARGSDQDITARKKATEQQETLHRQLQQAQKMEAIGQLAGGIAHDFNNVLTVIMNCVEFLRDALEPDAPAMAEVAEISNAARRAKDLTHQLLAFSRQQVMSPRIVSANALIENIQKMLLRVLPEKVSLKLALDPSPLPVKVDTTQLDQVILNLAINARDAMNGDGTITIRTGKGRLTPEDAARLADPTQIPDTPMVTISVTDTGSGIPPGIIPRLFEPFFTTKAAGKGTGLGLPMVFGIIRQHQGNVAIHSEVGRGTTFTLYLPLYAEIPAEKAVAKPKPSRPKGTETILLTEDDDSVRVSVGRILERLGYKVLEAENGEEAIKIARQHEGSIDLLITDLQMPGIDGYETARQFITLRAGAVVLYSSGYADANEQDSDIFPGGRKFVHKPYNIEELARVIREALDEKK